MRLFPPLCLVALLSLPAALAAGPATLNIRGQDAAGAAVPIAGAGTRSLSTSPVSVASHAGQITLTAEEGTEADIELHLDRSLGVSVVLRARFAGDQALTLAFVPIDVTGRILLGDQPLAGVPVSLSSDGIDPWGGPDDAPELHSGVRARIVMKTITGADGRFRFTRAIPQNYAVACGGFTPVRGPLADSVHVGEDDLWIFTTSAEATAIHPLAAGAAVDLGDAFVLGRADARLTLTGAPKTAGTVTLFELPTDRAEPWPTASGPDVPWPRRVRGRVSVVLDARGAAEIALPTGLYMPRIGEDTRLAAHLKPFRVRPGPNSLGLPTPPAAGTLGTLVLDAAPLWDTIRRAVLGYSQFRVTLEAWLSGGPPGWPEHAAWLADVESQRAGFRRTAGVYSPVQTTPDGTISFVKGVESATFENVPEGHYTAGTRIRVEWIETPGASPEERARGIGQAAAMELNLRGTCDRQTDVEVRKGGTLKVRVGKD